MKIKILALLFIHFTTLAPAQNYSISRWMDGKRSAIVLTFDDGTYDHPKHAIPMLDHYGVKGTFYVNAAQNYVWHKKALANGHEIANHTNSHPHLLSIAADSLKVEISDFKKELQAQIGAQVTTFAYPYGEGSEMNPVAYEVQDTVANGHIAGRGVYSHGISEFPYDFAPNERAYYKLPTLTAVSEQWYYLVDQCAQDGGLLPIMYHGIGAPEIYENISLERFEKQIQYLKAKGDKVWLTTLANAVKYHRERKGAKLTEISAPFARDNNWELVLTDTLRDDWYDFPLSIRLAIPKEVTAVMGIKQGAQPLSFQVEGDTLYFNAVPDRGNIHLDILNCQQAEVELNIIGKDTVCLPSKVAFKLAYDSAYAYTWYKEGWVCAKGNNTFYPKESGRYHAKVEWNGCPLETEKVDLVVTGECGVPKVDFVTNRSFQFRDEPVVFLSTCSNLEGTEKFYWDFGSGASLKPGYYGPGPIKVRYTSGYKNVRLAVEGRLQTVEKTKVKVVQIEDYTACHIFKNDYTNPLKTDFMEGWNNFSFLQSNGVLRIETNAKEPHQWHAVDYRINNGAEPKTLDFSEPLTEPVFKLRMKASDTCRVAITLIDANGIATAGAEVHAAGGLDVTQVYQEFEIDFSGLFFHKNRGLDLDSTRITHVRIAINPGYQSHPVANRFGKVINSNFVGQLDIDWMSFGANCRPETADLNKQQ